MKVVASVVLLALIACAGQLHAQYDEMCHYECSAAYCDPYDDYCDYDCYEVCSPYRASPPAARLATQDSLATPQEASLKIADTRDYHHHNRRHQYEPRIVPTSASRIQHQGVVADERTGKWDHRKLAASSNKHKNQLSFTCQSLTTRNPIARTQSLIVATGKVVRMRIQNQPASMRGLTRKNPSSIALFQSCLSSGPN